jgi:integrase
MPLAMSRPWKHPKTGIYWLRKGVPKALREVVGKREEKFSLQTRDPAEAKLRHAEALSEIEKRWANLRAGPKSLTEREAHQMAAPIHDNWLARYRDNPSQQTTWDVELGDRLFASRKLTKSSDFDFLYDSSISVDHQEFDVLRMEQLSLQGADDCLAHAGFVVDDASRKVLARAIAAAVQRASLALTRLAKGETIAETLFSPAVSAPSLHLPSQRPVSFQEIVDGWALERRPVAKTQYEWTRVIRELEKFLNHKDAHRLTPDDLIRWKQSMVVAGLKPKTIQAAKLSPVRAILQWGIQNRLIQSNPADGISLDARTKSSDRKRGFTDDEAKIILRAALKASDAVRRWVPWIGAYTGARISEICQLRSEDICRIEDIWCIKFLPEAGSLKTAGSERVVPLHPALIESGLLKFVEKAKSGPLFKDLSPDKFGKRGGNGTKMIGRFVRDLGLKDPRLSPSHSWRHRIKTLGRKYGLASDLMNAITGHQPETVGDSYGHYPVDALFRELCKIPQLKLDES